MKKFYETLRASFNPVTFKHYEKVKVFEKLEDAIAYAKRYSRDCGKCHFTDMLIYECTPRDDVYEVDAFSADMLRSSDECKQIYVATCCDGVLRACNTEAEQTSEADEVEQANEADEAEPESKSVVAESTESYAEPEKTEKSDAPEYSLQNHWGSMRTSRPAKRILHITE